MARIRPHTAQAHKAERHAYRVAHEAAIDGLIALVTPGTVPRLDSRVPYRGCTAMWNLLQYPAIVFPVDGFKGGADCDGVIC